MAVIGIGSDGNMAVLFPSADWNAPSDASLVAQKEAIVIGKDDFDVQINGTGVAQILVLASASPLRNALKGLQRIASSRGVRSGMLPLEQEAANAVEDLLAEFDTNSRSAASFATPSKARKAISTDQLAAISIALEVVS
jgi:hypothetical protein